MPETSSKLSKRLTFWFFILCLFMGLVTHAIYRSITHLVIQTEWVSHTYEVIQQTEQILSDLKDVQNAQRGYVLTGNKQYLAPYDTALPRIETGLDNIKVLSKDSPKQQENIAFLVEAVAARIETASIIINTYDHEGEKTAVEMVNTGRGEKEMDDVRRIVQDMQNQEQLLLGLRKQDAQQAFVMTLIICGVGLLSCIGILGGIFTTMRREINDRRLAQESLERLNHHIMLINKLNELLQSCQGLSEASGILKEYVGMILPGTYGFIALVNNSRNLLEVQMRWGNDQAIYMQDFTTEECWALRSGKTHLVDALNINPPCAHVKDSAHAHFCVPMMAHGEAIGLFYVASDDPLILSAEHQSRIRTLTEQAALGLSNLKLQDVLRMQSIKDPLTHLFNRRYMEVTLEREISRAKRNGYPIGLIMIDLDHFKRTNDTHGHEAGDAVLKEVAGLIKRTIRTEDIACRYGGEEFIIILPNMQLNMLQARAEALREAMHNLTLHFRHELLGPFTLSAGVSMYPVHGEKVEHLLAAADAALYKAKESRDRIVVAK